MIAEQAKMRIYTDLIGSYMDILGTCKLARLYHER